MSSKPCKFFIGDSKEPLDYNQMREYLFKNPDFVKISEPPVVKQTTTDVGGESAPDVSVTQAETPKVQKEKITDWENEGIQILEKYGAERLKDWVTNQTLLGEFLKVKDLFNKVGVDFPQTGREFENEVRKVGDIDKLFDIKFGGVFDFFLRNSNYNPREIANKKNSEIQKNISELQAMKKDVEGSINKVAKSTKYKKITEKNAKTISRTDRSDRIGDYYFSTGSSITIKTPERLVSDYVDSKIKELQKNLVSESSIIAEEKRIESLKSKQTPTTNETETNQSASQEASKSANEAVSTERNIRAEGQEAVEPVAAAAVSDEVIESPKPNEGGAKDVKPDDNERNIAAIKSKRLTHVPGTRMGANQAEGMYISTEDSNRYTDLHLPTAGTLQDVTVNIKNPFVSYDIGFADMHNEVLNENKDKFEDIDFIGFAPPADMDVWNTDILSEFGNAKVVKLTTDKLKSLGYDSVYFPQTYYQEGELIVFDRGNVGLKPKTDAIQEQATSEVPVQPKAGTGKEVAQGTSESKAEKPAQKSEKKLSKEAEESLDKRDFAIRLKEYNDLPKTQKRTEEGNSMLQGLKNDAKKLKYSTEVVATKSKGFVLNVKDKSGKVISVATAKRVGNPDAAIWSNEDTFVNFGRNQDGTKVIRIYDANSLVELDNRSKKYQDAKLNFIRSYAPNFIGTKEPIDYNALGERYGFDFDGYNVAVAQQLARTNNAFEIAANFNILDILDNLESLNQEYNVERALADWLGSISESDVRRYFDPNWLKGSRSSWVSKSNTIPLDKRVQALVNTEDGRGVEVPELSQYANDEGGVIEAISELIQKYPNGANSVPKTTNPYAQDIKNNFRELTGLELNEETAAMFEALYYNTDFAGIQSDLSWEQLSEEAKTQITNEQEQAFPADENPDGATAEIRATTSEGEGGTEQTSEAAGIEVETPSKETKADIKDDGFEVPTQSEMEAKRSEIKSKFDEAIKELKDSFGDLLNQNLGVVYDHKTEARKLYRFHTALVNAARLAIRLGMTDVKMFAQQLGKPRADKFMQRAWDDAQLAEQGRPMIINSEDDMLNATYLKVAESYKKQYDDAEAAKKPWFKKIIEGFHKALFEPDYVARKALKDIGATQALIDKTLVYGTSARAKNQYDGMRKEVFGGLSKAEKEQLNNIIQARTIISIDTRKDAKNEKRPKHPGDTTMEEQKVWLGQLEQDNPSLYAKLSDRADKYFEAQRELLNERLKEGRITIAQYDGMINNEYSPRKFLEYLVEENELGKSVSNGSVAQSDIKSLDEGSVNSLYHNAEWLLQTNVLATNRSIFHNRANRSLYDFAKANPNNGLIDIQQPNGFSSQTGQPTYADPKVGYKQIQFFEDGIRRSMIVPNDFYNSWNNTEPLMNPAFANSIRIATGGIVKRLFTTGANPAFALANIPRDIAHVLFFTNTYSPVFPIGVGQLGGDIIKVLPDVLLSRLNKDIVRVLPSALRNRANSKGNRYYKYLEEGGGMDFLTVQGRPFEKTGLESNKITDGVNAVVAFAGYINEVSELAVRLAIRERELNKMNAEFLKKNGRMPSNVVASGQNMSEQERIQRNATAAARSQMDFSRGGKWAKAVDTFIPYFNASLQGVSVSARYVKDNRATFGFKVAQFAMVAIGLTLNNLRYDEYDDIPEEEKARYIIIMLPFTEVNEEGQTIRKYIRIPINQSVATIKVLAEGMTEWSVKGKRPVKAVGEAVGMALPMPNPMNVPVVDALNLYATNFDRFTGKKVYKEGSLEAGSIPPELEYYDTGKRKTPYLYRDLASAAKKVGVELSPERFKEALGKLTADPDNNIYYVILAKAYDQLLANIPEDERQEVSKQMQEDFEAILTPFQRKFYSQTNPNAKKKSVREIEQSVLGVEKLQDDQVNKFVKRYIRGQVGEAEARRDFKEWLRTQEQTDTVNTERLKNKFEYSIMFKGVDNVFYRMRSAQRDNVKAHVFFYDWVRADEQQRKVLIHQGESLGLIPKSKETVFWREFNRLKENLAE